MFEEWVGPEIRRACEKVRAAGKLISFYTLGPIGELMDCSMCSGWWVGFAWGLYCREPIFESIVIGGLVSVTAFLADEMFALLSAGSRVLMRRLRPAPPPQGVSRRRRPPEEPMSEVVGKTVDGDGEVRALTEEEAHASIGATAEER